MAKTRAQRFKGTSSHGPSIKNPAVYEALRREGAGKTKAAKISNAALNKRTQSGAWTKKGVHRKRK
jgi:hypothetical protein